MAHFARIDKNNIVKSVHPIDDKELLNEDGDEVEVFGVVYLNKVHGAGFTWIQTSYNGSFRKNYAKKGCTYDKERDAFISPKLYNSWILNEDTCQWNAPKTYPVDDKNGQYAWDEDDEDWKFLPKPDMVVY
jgi:hypothetical protein